MFGDALVDGSPLEVLPAIVSTDPVFGPAIATSSDAMGEEGAREIHEEPIEIDDAEQQVERFEEPLRRTNSRQSPWPNWRRENTRAAGPSLNGRNPSRQN